MPAKPEQAPDFEGRAKRMQKIGQGRAAWRAYERTPHPAIPLAEKQKMKADFRAGEHEKYLNNNTESESSPQTPAPIKNEITVTDTELGQRITGLHREDEDDGYDKPNPYKYGKKT